MSTKLRLSASVDAAVMAAAQAAVSAGRATNISAWVNEALHRQADHDRRMQALDDFLHAYETEHGAITDDEIQKAGRRAQARALVVRDRSGKGPWKRKRRSGARAR